MIKEAQPHQPGQASGSQCPERPYGKWLQALCFGGLAALSSLPALGASRPYNVIFVAIDDLNDWISPLGGHPQAITPNFDRLAESSVTFTKAMCPSTVCGPSRSALLTGRHAFHTGVYGNNTNLKDAAATKALETLPEYFGNRGYHTLITGKVFHKHATEHGVDQGHWAFQEIGLTDPVWGFAWEKSLEKNKEYRWGAWNVPMEKTLDYVAAQWAARQLDRNFDGKPFFLALGLAKPHLPFHAPKKFFDMYPLETLKTASFARDDFDDILRPDGKPVFPKIPGGEAFEEIDENGLHAEVTQAYLASVSYVDACLGVLLDALDKSPYRENTIVVVWGDHGWHLGEKLRYGKTWLWQESARVPLFVRVPGDFPKNIKSPGVVNLIDLYPTLLELCGLPENSKNDGTSFARLLKDPSMVWETPTLTTYNPGNHSVYDGRYRYTLYRGLGNSEELYDHRTDPEERTNLASRPDSREIIDRLSAYLPETEAPSSPINPHNAKIQRFNNFPRDFQEAFPKKAGLPRSLLTELRLDGVVLGGESGKLVTLWKSEDGKAWQEISDMPELKALDPGNIGRVYSHAPSDGVRRYYQLKPVNAG